MDASGLPNDGNCFSHEAVRLIRAVIARRLTRDHRAIVDRETVFQDAYLAVHDLIAKTEESEREVARARIAAISSNIATSALRHAYAQKRGGDVGIVPLKGQDGSSLEDLYRLVSRGHTPSHYISRKEIKAVLGIALRKLPDRERRIAHLHWVEGKSRSVIGELLGMNANSVNTLLFRVKAELARELASALGSLSTL